MPLSLPPGRTAPGSSGALWVSEKPVKPALWPVLRAQHPQTGRWPLLLGGGERPWDSGELWPGRMSSPDAYDGAEVLARWHDPETAGGVPLDLTVSREPAIDPGECADRGAETLTRLVHRPRLGLVTAARGSDALTLAGWSGPCNHASDTAEISAVLRSWEDRFGVRVIGAGFDELYVSVAAPPADLAEALAVAAEHAAFCPDNVAQGAGTYAEDLVGAPLWHFWWD